MGLFDIKLNSIISEMPMQYKIAGDTDAEGKPWEYTHPTQNTFGQDDRSDDKYATRRDVIDKLNKDQTRGRQFGAWSSIKFLEALSDKLSRLTNYNLILFVGGNINPPYFKDGNLNPDRFNKDVISKMSGIPIHELENSITVNITSYGGGQHTASPWIILHQVSEAIWGNIDNSEAGVKYGIEPNSYDSSFWSAVHNHFLQEYYGDDYNKSYQDIFKFKSASDPGDLDQELMTEYLWHGGKIRTKFPPQVPKEIILKIKAILEQVISDALDNAVGNVYDNTIEL